MKQMLCSHTNVIQIQCLYSYATHIRLSQGIQIDPVQIFSAKNNILFEPLLYMLLYMKHIQVFKASIV